MWFIFANTVSTSGVEFAYIDNNKAYHIKYKNALPSILKVKKVSVSCVEVITDGYICEFDLVNMNDIIRSKNVIHIPDGMRFGIFMARNNVIEFVHDFWKVPSVQYRDGESPTMVLVRPREQMVYTVEVM